MRTGNTITKAGRNNTEKKKAAITPMATVFPRSLNGGTSLKFIVMKPSTVVTLVMNTGCKLIRILSCIASALGMPCRMLKRNVTSMCTQSATAMVVITVGALVDGPVSVHPSQPNIPIAVRTESRITTTVANVPVIERSSSHSVTIMTRNIIGSRLVMSFFADSAKALPSMTLPVI